MPLGILILVWALVLGGGVVMAIPLLPQDDHAVSVEANIRECREVFRGSSGVTYATLIDRPPGEIRFEIGASKSEKMIGGYRAACGSGKPVRIDYWRSGTTIQEVYRVRGIEGIDGTDYFTVADSQAAEAKGIYYYATAICLFMWLLAYLFYKSAKIRMAQAQAAAQAARRSGKGMKQV